MESVWRTILRYGHDKHGNLENQSVADVALALLLILVHGISPVIRSMSHDVDIDELEAIFWDICSLLKSMGNFTVNQIDYEFYATFLWNEIRLLRSCDGSQARITQMASSINERMKAGNPRTKEFVEAGLLVSRHASGYVGRCLFRSINRRIGMGAWPLQEHDEIWLLAGSRVPFLLRPRTNGRYQLVSEAHVDGAMFGELWPAADKNLMNIIVA